MNLHCWSNRGYANRFSIKMPGWRKLGTYVMGLRNFTILASIRLSSTPLMLAAAAIAFEYESACHRSSSCNVDPAAAISTYGRCKTITTALKILNLSRSTGN